MKNLNNNFANVRMAHGGKIMKLFKDDFLLLDNFPEHVRSVDFEVLQKTLQIVY